MKKIGKWVVKLRHVILIAALRRHESRGLHYILDYPNPSPKTKHQSIYLSDKK